MQLLNRRDVIAAAHTLWQSALGSGGIATIVDNVSPHGLNLSGVKQGAGVAAVAVLAALGALVKAYVLQWLAGRKGALAEIATIVEDAAKTPAPADAGFVGPVTLLGVLMLAGGLLAGAAGALLVVVVLAVLGAIVTALVTGSTVAPEPVPVPLVRVEPGTIGVTPSSGFVPWLVRVVTRGPVAHAFIATGRGDEIVEGEPGGARLGHASEYKVVYWLTGLAAGMSTVERARAVVWAVDHLGTGYSFLDDLSIGLEDLFGWTPPFMRRRLASTRTLMCSQLCDAALQAGGLELFPDRPAGAVSPNDLYRLNLLVYASRRALAPLAGDVRTRSTFPATA